MGKKKKLRVINFDYTFSLDRIVPSGYDGFRDDKVSKETVAKKKKAVADLEDILKKEHLALVKGISSFPARGKVLVFVIQFFASKDKYNAQDVDNTAKTIMDMLKVLGIVGDDGQVKTLITTKCMDDRVGGDFFYCGIKHTKDDNYEDVVKCCGIENAVQEYQGLMKFVA